MMETKCKFTTSINQFNIGDAIFPVDFSMFHLIEEETSNVKLSFLELEKKRDEIREKLSKGIPLIVLSAPYRIEKFGWFENEYYIKVMIADTEEVFSIANSKVNVFKNVFKYIEFVNDCEACASCGY